MISRNFKTVKATYPVQWRGGKLQGIIPSIDATLPCSQKRLVGPNFSNDVTRRLTSMGSVSAGRGHPSPLQHQGERSEEPEGNPGDKKGKKSEKKEDKKREEDP